MIYHPGQQHNMRSRMESYGTAWSGHPNDPNAPEETRPEGCTCRYDDGYINAPAAAHDEDDERCDLFACPECEHAKRDHGKRGCEAELGDRFFPSKGISEAGGLCQCERTQEEIVLIGRFGSLEVGRRIEQANIS